MAVMKKNLHENYLKENKPMKNKYEVFLETPYALLKKTILKWVKPGSRILDLGAYEGRLEDYLEEKGGRYIVECVDVDAEALRILKAKKYENVEANAIHADANQYLEDHQGSNDTDAIFLSAVLHEINDPLNQSGYLKHFFEKAKSILGPEGIIIIADLYYPDSVSDEEVENFREYQLRVINHADPRNKFVRPELIKIMAEENGFSVELFKEIRAVKEIDRRYYVIILKATQNTE
jgi:SAM-dependent methyltransferase